MSQQGKSNYGSFRVTEDLSAKQYYFLKIGASDKYALLNDSKGGFVVGVLDETSVNGSTNEQNARVAVGPYVKVKLSGTVTRGQDVIAAADGTGVVADAAGQFVPCRALESGVSGDVIECMWVAETNHA